MDSITQTPFQPLVQPNQLMNTAPGPVVQDIGEGINPRLFTPPGTADIDRIGEINRSLDKNIEQQGSFWPNALAIGALLTGNFGPMIQLEEQKRKTAIGQLATPYMMEATNLAHQGKFEEAQNVVTTAIGKVGPRSPEVMQMFKPVMDKLSKDQTNWRDMQQVADFAKMTIPDDAHPDAVNFRDFAQKAVKNRTVVSSELLGTLFTKAIPHMQMINNQAIGQGGLSGRITSIPLPEVQNEKQLETPGGMRVAAHNNMTTGDLTNVLRLREPGQSVTLGDGRTVSFGDATYTKARNEYTGYGMQFDAALEVGKQVPLEPILSTQALGRMPADAVATRQGFTQQGMVPALMGDHYTRLTDQQVAVIEGKLRKDPYLPLQSGYTTIDASPDLSRFGTRVGPMTYEEMKASGGKYINVETKILNDRIEPAVKAIQGLGYMTQMLPMLGAPDTPYTQVVKGINRFISDKIGRDVAKGLSVEKAAELFVERSIEEVQNTKQIDDRVVRQLKERITGRFRTPQDAMETVAFVQQRLQEEVYRLSGVKVEPPAIARPTTKGAVPTEAPTTLPAQQIPGVPTPNVKQVPTPGVEPGAAYRQPGGGFVPQGETTYTPPQRGKPKSAIQTLAPIVDQAPAATEYKYVKPGTLR